MANWCFNRLVMRGVRVGEIKDIFNSMDDSDKLFTTVTGIVSNDNYETWGCKWDVEKKNVHENIIFAGEENEGYVWEMETGWSQPDNFCYELHKKFGVDIELTYEEPNNDFYGRLTVTKDGETDECYSYNQGLYTFNKEGFWRELENDLREDIECDGEDFSLAYFMDNYTDNKKFTQEDILRVRKLYEQILNEKKGGE